MLGVFGWNEEKKWTVAIGMHEKGGIYDGEFLKYFNNSLILLYPDVKYEDVKCVILKVDSGTGRLNQNILAYERNLVLIIYPGVPNNTSVRQDMDQNYGLFKTQFIENLNMLSAVMILHNGYTNLQPWMVVIIVFGGITPESKV